MAARIKKGKAAARKSSEASTVDIPRSKYDEAGVHLERARALMQLALPHIGGTAPEVVALQTVLESIISADDTLYGEQS